MRIRTKIEKCAEAIEKVIAPKLNEPFIVEQALSVAKLLRTLAPNVHEDEWLQKDNALMGGVLKEAAELVRKEPAIFEQSIGKACALMETDEQQKAGMVLSEENYNLRMAFMETIKGLNAVTSDKAAEMMSPLRRRIHAVLREQVDYELARIGGRRSIGDAVVTLEKKSD